MAGVSQCASVLFQMKRDRSLFVLSKGERMRGSEAIDGDVVRDRTIHFELASLFDFYPRT
jgi:hypothetical protein